MAVATNFGAHFEAYVPVAWTLERLLRPLGGTVQMYPGSLGHQYDRIINYTGMYHGSYQSPTMLEADLNSTTLFPDDKGAMIDLIVFGTCELE